MRHRARRGAASIEAALVMPAIVLFLWMALGYPISAFSRAAVERRIDTAGYTLPADWESRNAKDTLREALLSDGTLNGDLLTVETASINVDHNKTVKAPGAGDAATGHINGVVTRAVDTVTINGRVAYKLAGSGMLPGAGDGITIYRDVVRTYRVSGKYEVS